MGLNKESIMLDKAEEPYLIKRAWELFSCLYWAKDKEEKSRLFCLINSLKNIENKKLYDFIKSEEENYNRILESIKRGIV